MRQPKECGRDRCSSLLAGGGNPQRSARRTAPGMVDTIHKELLHLGQTAIRPAYDPLVVPCQLQGATVLVIWAPGGPTRPYKARLSLGKDNQEFGYYLRKGSSTVRATGRDEAELLSLAATVPFDDRINQTARLEDLSLELMRAFLAEVGSDLAAEASALDVVWFPDGPGGAKFTNPDVPRSSKQRCRVTADGRAWLTRHAAPGGSAS